MGYQDALRAIWRYESSVGTPMECRTVLRGRDGSLRTACAVDDVDRLLRHTEQASSWLEFGECVHDALGGGGAHGYVMVESHPPENLLRLGLEDIPIYHTRKHLLSEHAPRELDAKGRVIRTEENLHRHGLSERFLRRVPELLETPALVMNSNPRTLISMLPAVDRYGCPVIAIIDPAAVAFDPQRGLVEANLLKSVYGRLEPQRMVDDHAKRGRVVYIDHSMADDLFARTGIACPRGLARMDGYLSRATLDRSHRDGPTVELVSRLPRGWETR